MTDAKDLVDLAAFIGDSAAELSHLILDAAIQLDKAKTPDVPLRPRGFPQGRQWERPHP